MQENAEKQWERLVWRLLWWMWARAWAAEPVFALFAVVIGGEGDGFPGVRAEVLVRR